MVVVDEFKSAKSSEQNSKYSSPYSLLVRPVFLADYVAFPFVLLAACVVSFYSTGSLCCEVTSEPADVNICL